MSCFIHTTSNVEYPQLNIGFIGGGLSSAIGVVHKISSQMDNCFKLVCGCFSSDSKINHLTAKKWGISSDRVYDDHIQMLKNEADKIDAIVILTPTPMHAKIIKDCIKFGKSIPIICEKSLATSTKEILSIKKNLNTKQLLIVTYNYTAYPMIRELKEILETNKLGTIKQIFIEMPQESFIKETSNTEQISLPKKWRIQDLTVPILSLDLGVHVYNMLLFLIPQKPTFICAHYSTLGKIPNVIDNVVATLKFDDDRSSSIASIWYSKSALGNRNGLKIRIFGTKGAIKWSQSAPECLWIYDNKGNVSILDRGSCGLLVASEARYNRFKAGHPSGFIEAFANYYYDIWQMLVNFKSHKKIWPSKYLFGIGNSLDIMNIIEAEAKSAKLKKWVKINYCK